MNRSPASRVVPGLLMTAAAAVPVLTTAELMAHAGTGAGQATTPLVSRSPSQNGSAGNSAAASAKSAASAAPGVHVYSGPAVQDPFGSVQAQVTMNGSKITNVSITAPMDNPRSASINSQAVPMLQRETLQAQSSRINVISGATYTSRAYQQSLQGALPKAGLASGTQSGTSSSGAPSAGHVTITGSDD